MWRVSAIRAGFFAVDVVAGRHVMDLCTGTGIAAIAAAELGATSVTAWDICPRAVRCAQAKRRPSRS